MTESTEAEREALVKAILSARWANGDPLSGVTSRTAQMIAGPILAAGFRRVAVTEDMVSIVQERVYDDNREGDRPVIREALEAALAAEGSE
jgi:hypothetical protein